MILYKIKTKLRVKVFQVFEKKPGIRKAKIWKNVCSIYGRYGRTIKVYSTAVKKKRIVAIK